MGKNKREGQWRMGVPCNDTNNTHKPSFWGGWTGVSGTYEWKASKIFIAEGKWPHIVLTMRINPSTGDYFIGGYVNNERADSKTGNKPNFKFNVDHTESVFINDDRSNYHFYGDIDEIRVYTRMLSSTEIHKLYAEGVERLGLDKKI